MKSNFVTLGLLSITLAACGGGENGIDGKDGKDGDSCTITNNEDGTATITCPDGSSFTVKNGEDGKKGDAGSDGEKGQNGESCKLVENIDGSAAVVCPYDGTSYIVRGNTDNYENYCAPGFYGKNCENECNCPEHSNCNDGVTGDGSCTCEKGYYGDNCVNCTKGVEGSYFGKEECTYTDTRDSNSEVIYPVVKIGDQLWMAENLKAKLDVNGNEINCYANKNADQYFLEKYGCLYVWNELATLNGETNKENTNRICPSGWRLPKIDDFDNLLTYVTNNRTASSNFLALIEQSTAWTNYSNQGIDEFGFGALPAGFYYYGYYNDFGDYGYFWSSTEYNDSGAFSLYLGQGGADVSLSNKAYGYSVRCLKDAKQK